MSGNLSDSEKIQFQQLLNVSHERQDIFQILKKILIFFQDTTHDKLAQNW
jgi:hypothetical protein